ncbi:hypothetical protein QJS10_CPA08g00078 [Acorus calamus]|uniref:C2 domain-containing protein n=1 Tax=Acorus calamus TaxID=4465 RepID=A0AAV9EAJ4_ACOCL|nr:hypothetical protein QJS10_CPA08g00078 [Acorus calamus]
MPHNRLRWTQPPPPRPRNRPRRTHPPPAPLPPVVNRAPPPQAEEPPPPPERTTFDLVEKMHYLFVRVVRARSLAPKSARAYVRLSIPGVQVRTSATGSRNGGVSFEWDQTFAFARGGVGGAGDGSDYASTLEVSVWDEQGGLGPVFLGGVCFDALDVPLRDPPDSPLAPQWYRLEGRGRKGGGGGDLMLATWIGTQADKLFADAWKSETAASAAAHAKSKVYLSPKMWYRPRIRDRSPAPKVQRHPKPLRPRHTRLSMAVEREGRLQVRVCFDGGYHVADEPAHAASDYRPSVGTVELGLVGCRGLVPHKPGACYYAVAKYGPKWARTRGVPGGDGGVADAMWNEQYTWQVFDPCTVLTVAVFASDEYLGRVRIRVSALESGVAYRSTYALMTLSAAGVRKSGDVDIAVRFSRAARRRSHARVHPADVSNDAPRATHRRGADGRAADHGGADRRGAPCAVRAVAADGGGAARARRNAEEQVQHARAEGELGACGAVAVVGGGRRSLGGRGTRVAEADDDRARARVLMLTGARLSAVEAVGADELDEEFDGVPSGRDAEVVRVRYDRLRTLGGWAQAALGEVAGHGERVRAVVEWRNLRATLMFMGACMVASVGRAFRGADKGNCGGRRVLPPQAPDVPGPPRRPPP